MMKKEKMRETSLLLPVFITPEIINFMLHKARGLVCLSITQKQADQLNLLPMTSDNQNNQQTAFTVTVDAARDITFRLLCF